MLEEANKLYQEMEKQYEEGLKHVKTLESENVKLLAERGELTAALTSERESIREANVREQDLCKKLQKA